MIKFADVLASAFTKNLSSTLQGLYLCTCDLNSETTVKLAKNFKYIFLH